MSWPEILFDPEEMKARGYGPEEIAKARLAKQAREVGAVLMTRIERAFEGIPRPRITLTVASGLDDEWTLSPEREAELREKDPEENWRDVDVSEVWISTYINFGDAEGCRFYLPAFLREVLAYFPYSDRDEILGLLSRPDKTALLNEEQMSCLLDFARLCENYPE